MSKKERTLKETPKTEEKQLGSVFKLTALGLLGALSIVLVHFNFPIIPIAPWLKLDFADVPILICLLLFGIAPSLSVLFVISVIQAFFLGGDGLIGLFMHFVASGAMLAVVGAICGKKPTLLRLIIALCAGTLTMTAVMIPMNYIIMPLFNGTAAKDITTMLLPAIIPFNLIKAGSNCVLAGLLYRLLLPFLRKMGFVC